MRLFLIVLLAPWMGFGECRYEATYSEGESNRFTRVIVERGKPENIKLANYECVVTVKAPYIHESIKFREMGLGCWLRRDSSVMVTTTAFRGFNSDGVEAMGFGYASLKFPRKVGIKMESENVSIFIDCVE